MFEEINDTTFESMLLTGETGVCIFYKQLCPHCKNMERVLDKFAKLQPSVRLFSIDLEQNPTAAKACEAERVPTIITFRDGKVLGRKVGLMNPREMVQFFESCR